ncbi:hypothetical protein JD844_005846 [Phrynosoma platyrhinos]|uniref:Cytochrome P450 2G1 n=1 Tax=Phrynosoma platyrhinos TaxID=52577 RepID=A0ABQ7TPU3_PHRPL|nr:hypothetical protein JD844_005846 [Phrynosoma platyrhinos]
MVEQVKKTIAQLREKYGPVFTVYFGTRPVVVLCGHQAVKEALVDKAEEFGGRVTNATVEDTFQGYGVIFSNGERWKQLRRFSLTIMRNFGMGKKTIEERIKEESQFLLEEFRKTNGKPFNPTYYLNRAVANVISSILFGDRFDYENEIFQGLTVIANDIFRRMSTGSAQMFDVYYSFLKYFPGPQTKINELLEQVRVIIAQKVKSNQETLDLNFPRDYIDCFLIQMEKEKDNPSSEFTIKNLELTVLILLFAGTETVSSTLRYGFLFLMKNPEIQAKMHEEIDRVIGRIRPPNIGDRTQLPYVDAVVHEVQRFSDILPLDLPHMVIRDTEFRGYKIPKGTEVYPILSSVLFDPTMFKNPYTFNPEHFLDENGRFKKSDAFVPFSSGKRICLGETLARMELFLFLTTIMQKFQLKPLVAPKDIDLTPNERKLSNKGKLPPGPTPLPLIGNFLQIKASETLKSLLKLREKYGPVFTVYFGTRPIVVLCGHQAVKEALVDKADEFSGRQTTPTLEPSFQGYGVVFANGERWKQMRRFSLTVLRDFGMEKPFDPTYFLSRAVSNVICSIVFGNRFDYEDKDFQALLEMINNSFREMSTAWAQLYDIYVSILKYFPGPQDKVYKYLDGIRVFIAKRVEKNQETLDPNFPRDFIDCFLIQMEKEKDNPASEFNMRNLELTTLTLFFGGTETVSSTLRYGFLFLMKYPEIQAKVHEEIDRVIGHNRVPNIEDRIRMPYTDAVIHEVQRYSDLIPMDLPHMVIRDTEFRGYMIPKVFTLEVAEASFAKAPILYAELCDNFAPAIVVAIFGDGYGTEVYPVLSSVLHDPTMFKKPYTFYPEHFLDENGCFKKNDAFVPFSSGKRICLGEALARMELFLFFTTILQSFSLKPLMDPEEIDVTPMESGFATIPPFYELSVIPR